MYYIDRKLVKQNAKAALKANYWSIVGWTVLGLAIIVACALVSRTITPTSAISYGLEKGMDSARSGVIYRLAMMQSTSPPCAAATIPS